MPTSAVHAVVTSFRGTQEYLVGSCGSLCCSVLFLAQDLAYDGAVGQVGCYLVQVSSSNYLHL